VLAKQNLPAEGDRRNIEGLLDALAVKFDSV
jgi:hypothetical protein